MEHTFNNATLMNSYKDSYRGGELLQGVFVGRTQDEMTFRFTGGGHGCLHIAADVTMNLVEGDLVKLRMHDPQNQLVVPRGLELERLGLKTVPMEGIVALTNSKLTSVYFEDISKMGVHFHSGNLIMKDLVQGQKIVCDVVKEFVHRGNDLYIYSVPAIYSRDGQTKYEGFSKEVFDAAVVRGSAEEKLGMKPGYLCTMERKHGLLMLNEGIFRVVGDLSVEVDENDRYAVRVDYIHPEQIEVMVTVLFKLDVL